MGCDQDVTIEKRKLPKGKRYKRGEVVDHVIAYTRIKEAGEQQPLFVPKAAQATQMQLG
jgi:hypothetical protein